MKTLAKLSIFVLVALQSTAAFANFQAFKAPTKNYLRTEMLSFSEKGIYLYSNSGKALPLSQIQYDAEGYYVAGFLDSFFPQSTVVAKCRSCGYEYYNRSPQPCEHCNQAKGFEVVYIDDGYSS